MKTDRLNRRNFFKQSLAAGAGAGLLGTDTGLALQTKGADLLRTTKIPRKPLGKTGVDVPILGMGGSQKFEPKYDKKLHRALQVGINYFDNSERYSNGQSQKTMGVFVEQVGRKNVWLTSKVSDKTHPAGSEAPPEHFKNNLEQVLQDMKTLTLLIALRELTPSNSL